MSIIRKYTQENLINTLNVSNGNDILFLLGAGCSVSSGCMASGKMVQEFKRRIYCAKKGIPYSDNTFIYEEGFNKAMAEEFTQDVENEYSYYFEMCFPNRVDRNQFIKDKFQNIKPSYGYLCFADYIISKKVKRILTTNFDKLCEKAIKKLDEDYDVTISTDSITSVVDSQLSIVELHGDYNYDALKNTEQELSTLSNKLMQEISSSIPKKIIVIGYSGQDKSVMDFLETLTSNHHNIELFWCSLKKDFNENKKVNQLLSYNPNSGYVLIDGFDDLFQKYYKFSGQKNWIIDSTYEKLKNDSFDLTVEDQPEKLLFNANQIISNPEIYSFKCSIEASSLKKIINEEKDIFAIQHKGYIYSIGDITKLINVFGVNSYEKVTIMDIDCPVTKKCVLLKETIKLMAKQKGFYVYRDNIYINNSARIKEGLEVSVDLLDRKFCLFSNVNYFIDSDDINSADKFEINKLKSNLYANQNYEKRNAFIDLFFPKDLLFEYYNTKVQLDKKSLGTLNNCTYFKDYNCESEPEMITNTNKSVNQIKLLNELGPRFSYFSPDKIKVGIFCVEQDKEKLSRFIDNIIYGTKSFPKTIFPQFRGFEPVFGKKIDFVFNALPPIDVTKPYLTKMNQKEFADFCIRGIDKMYKENQIDLALIFIGNNLSRFRTDNDFDLHDYIKVNCANKYKTQFLEEKTIESSDDINKRILNLSIALFTKTIGMPWYPKDYSKNTLFLGISFGRNSKGITVGCSQMFDGSGRGLQLIVSKIADKGRKNQYLSKQEAYDLGIKIRTTYYKTTRVDELKRIVIHRKDPFTDEEIQGFKKAFEGIDDFVLVQLTENTKFNSYKFYQDSCSGFPVKRGTTIKRSSDSAYVWTDGSIINSDILEGKTYRNNTRGMGRPIKIKKHYGKITTNEVVRDLMFLTKMDFNSSDVIYSKMPVTIKYSKKVCDLLKQGDFEDDLISFEYIM